jgi:lipoyl(octanoyl) transferase
VKSNLIQPGLVDYHEAWAMQRTLAEARAHHAIDDTLILLQHPHTYTLGRSAHREHLLLSADECAKQSIDVVDVDRGGDITYHGPGQLVAYPIRYLGQVDPQGKLIQADYVGYIRHLEEILIRTIAPFGIAGRRDKGLTGVWVDTRVGPAKIAAIGVRVSARGVSTHGVALNVTTDLSYFDGIIPCGIRDKAVTSLWVLLRDATPSIQEVVASFTAAYSDVFDCTLSPTNLDVLLPAAIHET